MKLSFIPCVTSQQFRDLLLLRNESRISLTHNQNELTMQDQKFFKDLCWSPQKVKATYYKPYLLYDGDWPIGYGLLKLSFEDGEYVCYVTAGLAKQRRDDGLSRLLITYITEMAYVGAPDMKVKADVYDNNNVLFTDIKIGYIITDDIYHQGLHTLEHVRDREIRPEEKIWLSLHGR